jgi:hypothetical protein
MFRHPEIPFSSGLRRLYSSMTLEIELSDPVTISDEVSLPRSTYQAGRALPLSVFFLVFSKNSEREKPVLTSGSCSPLRSLCSPAALVLRSRSSMTADGPPPPSPFPNIKSDSLVTSRFLWYWYPLMISGRVQSESYRWMGVIWERTWVPSSPTQLKVVSGNSLLNV